jgi:hypothetical protein
MCTLPDDLSDAIDAQINLHREAGDHVEGDSDDDCPSKSKEDIDSDSMRALQHLETISSCHLSENRIFQTYLLFVPLNILAFLGREDRFIRVAEALLSVYKRYLGDHRGLATGEVMVEILSRLIENPRCYPYWRNWDPSGSQSVRRRIRQRLQKATTSIIFGIEKYP